MIPRPLAPLLVALVLTGGCAGPGAGVTDLSDQAGAAAERTRFCLSLARALATVDEGTTTATALDAAEETLARAPRELKRPARAVVDHLRRAAEGEPDALLAPAFATAVEDLRADGQRACDPTDRGG